MRLIVSPSAPTGPTNGPPSHRQVARHDQQRLIATLPQLRDGGCRKSQHATGALELVERRPVLEEPAEQLRRPVLLNRLRQCQL